MDGGITLTPNQINGRNTWIVWTGGNDRLWDSLACRALGALDLLKTLSSHPGLEGEPRQPLGVPRARERAVLRTSERTRSRALWAVARQARRGAEVPARSVRKRTEVPRREDRGARNDRSGRILSTATQPASSGCVCSRIRPSTTRPPRRGIQPVLHRSVVLQLEDARSNRIASACRAASATSVRARSTHRSIPNNPQWANLSSIVGAQYFWIDRIFDWNPDATQFHLPAVSHVAARHARHVVVSADNINNPRTMNAVYLVPPRLARRQALGQGDARRAASSTTSSSMTTCRPGAR